MKTLKHMEAGFYRLDWAEDLIVEVVHADDELREASFIDPYDPELRSHCDYRHFTEI